MKRLLTIFLSLCCLSAIAQTEVKKVAIIEPMVEDGEISTIYKAVLRSKLLNSISNEEVGYEAFTRTDVDAIMREQQFQNSGIVDDNTRIRLGNLGGVDCICISKLAEGAGYINIDIMLVDVQSGKVESAANKLIENNLEQLEQTAVELGKKLVGLDLIEQQRAEEQERQRQLELQRKQEEEQKRQQEIAAQEQHQQNVEQLGNSIAELGTSIANAIQMANSYTIIFENKHSSPRKITMGGQLIGYVDGYSVKSFQVPLHLQGILVSTQTKDYLFSPNVERFTISGVKKGQRLTIRN